MKILFNSDSFSALKSAFLSIAASSLIFSRLSSSSIFFGLKFLDFGYRKVCFCSSFGFCFSRSRSSSFFSFSWNFYFLLLLGVFWFDSWRCLVFGELEASGGIFRADTWFSWMVLKALFLGFVLRHQWMEFSIILKPRSWIRAVYITLPVLSMNFFSRWL